MTARTAGCPAQVPEPNPNFVNQVRVLEAAEVAVRQALAAGRGATVVFGGGPGTGKTAVALVLAARVRERFPDGQLFARLHGALDDDGAEAAVLGDFLVALGEDRSSLPDRLDARRALYQSLTSGRRLLVFLDGAVRASQVRTLQPAGGTSLVIATEARPLGTLAAHGPVTFLDLAPLEEEAAFALFERMLGTERAGRERPVLGEIIALCDELPLALSVVGALLVRFPGRPVDRIAGDLRNEQRRLRLLSRGDDVSVTAAFALATALLDETARACYYGLGSAPSAGQWSAAALAAALEMPLFDVEEGLRDLAEAKLVEELEPDVYLVRDLIRLHAMESDPAGARERENRSRRLLDHWLDGTVAADALIAPARPWRSRFLRGRRSVSHADRDAAMAWLRRERANLRAAVEYAYSVEEYVLVSQWCVALWSFYESAKLLDEMIATHALGRKAARKLADPALESLIATQAGYAHYLRRDVDRAVDEFRAAVECALVVADRELEATAVEGLGLALVEAGQGAEARRWLTRNLELATEIGDARRVALARLHLAKVLLPDEAADLLRLVETYFAAHRDEEAVNLAKTWTWRGIKLTEAGGYEEATPLLAGALDVMAGEGRRFDEAVALDALGDLARAAGDLAVARDRYREALLVVEDLGFSRNAEVIRSKLDQLGEP